MVTKSKLERATDSACILLRSVVLVLLYSGTIEKAFTFGGIRQIGL